MPKVCRVLWKVFMSGKSPKSFLGVCTVEQGNSKWLYNSRRIRITASSANTRIVPIREITNPDNFIWEHVYPTFKGNMFTKHDQEWNKSKTRNEGKWYHYYWCRLQMNHGLVFHWMISLILIIFLLEIKCPFLKNDSKLDNLLNSGKYDVFDSGTLILKPNGHRGYYLRVQLTMHVSGIEQCKLVIWSSSEYRIVYIQYDSKLFVKMLLKDWFFFLFFKVSTKNVDDYESGLLNPLPP